ncbi:MAG: Gfo/Idh/MocA family oxidoreductase [Pirellulales bacterium]
MLQTNHFSRRRFLAQGSVAGLAAIGTPHGIRAAANGGIRAAANEKLNLAFIGVGGRGGDNLRVMTGPNSAATKNVRVVALCDINGHNLEQAAKKFPQACRYTDFRRLYDHPADIDGVVVSTTEHTHAFATMPALQLGKHVYCEKPLTYNVYEARRITEAAASAGVATQMGTQIHSGSNYHRVVELIQSGAIGKVHEVHVWVSRAWGWQSEAEAKQNKDIVWVTERPQQSTPVPKHLDWNLWLGPAPERPFHDVYFPGPKWYRWWDFGNGTMSDLGSHWIDLPYWALKLDAPRTIEASGPPPQPEIAPASMRAVYEYGPRGDLPACKLNWYQGSYKPDIWREQGIPQWGNGVLFVGDQGMLLSDYGKHVMLPETNFQDYQPPTPFIPDSPGQQAEWLLACQNGTPTASPFSYAGPLTEANHLGNVAYRVGKKIHWDRVNLKATDCPEADPYLRRQPRTGWSLGII